VSVTWIVVVATGVGTLALKAAGPVLLGGRALPERLSRIATLLGPALLGALVAIGTFATGRSLVIDERLLGVGAAVVAIRLRAPVLAVVVLAAAVTVVARALG